MLSDTAIRRKNLVINISIEFANSSVYIFDEVNISTTKSRISLSIYSAHFIASSTSTNQGGARDARLYLQSVDEVKMFSSTFSGVFCRIQNTSRLQLSDISMLQDRFSNMSTIAPSPTQVKTRRDFLHLPVESSKCNIELLDITQVLVSSSIFKNTSGLSYMGGAMCVEKVNELVSFFMFLFLPN